MFLAERMPAGQQSIGYDDEANLTFIGLVGMLDPPREEVRDAIHSCMSAGIRVIVVTGDNKSTAESLCRQIGALEHLDDFAGYSYTASEFEGLPPLERANALQRMVLFSRVEPSHKKILVEALQTHNEVFLTDIKAQMVICFFWNILCVTVAWITGHDPRIKVMSSPPVQVVCIKVKSIEIQCHR